MDLTKIPYEKLKDLLIKIRAVRSKTFDGTLGYGEAIGQDEKWWRYFRMERRVLETLEILRGRENGRKNQQRLY